jgi:WD40 repeat protein
MNRPLSIVCLILLVTTASIPAGEPTDKTLPNGAIRRYGATTFRQGSPIKTMVVYPDGKRVATVSDKGIHLWDADKGVQIAFANFPQAPAKKIRTDPLFPRVILGRLSLTISRDGDTLLLLRNSGVYTLPASLKGEPTLLSEDTQLRQIRAVEFGVAGDRFFALDTKGTLVKWAAQERFGGPWQALPIDDMGEHAMLRVAGSLVVVGSKQGVFRFWDLDKKSERKPIHVDPACRTFALSGDGEWLAATSFLSGGKPTTEVWNTVKRKLMPPLEGAKWVQHLQFSPDASLLAGAMSSDNADEIALWDPRTGKRLHTLDVNGNHQAILEFSPDGSKLFVGGDQGTLNVWDPRTGKPLHDSAPQGAIIAVRLLKDGTVFAASKDGRFHQWPQEGYDAKVWPETVRHLSDLTFSDDEKTLFTAHFGGHLRAWDVPGRKLRFVKNSDQQDSYEAIGVSPDGKRLAAIMNFDEIGLLNAANGALLRKFKIGQNTGRSIAFLPDGKLLTRSLTELVLWDADQGKRIHTFETTSAEQGNTEFALSPDGKQVALVSRVFGVGTKHQADLLLWDIASNKIVERHNLNEGITSIASDRDWKWFILGTITGDVLVWNVAQQKLHATYSGGHRRAVECVAVSPDGRTFASGGTDTTVFLWKMPAP